MQLMRRNTCATRREISEPTPGTRVAHRALTGWGGGVPLGVVSASARGGSAPGFEGERREENAAAERHQQSERCNRLRNKRKRLRHRWPSLLPQSVRGDLPYALAVALTIVSRLMQVSCE